MMRTAKLSGRNEHVDWIEELFGISPDAGTGTLEALIAGTAVAVILGAVFALRSRAARQTEKSR